MQDFSQLDAIDLSYAAGFIDGEGCIFIGKFTKRGKTYYQLHVTAANTDFDVLCWFKDTFGGSLYSKKQTNGRRPAWTWELQTAQSESFLRVIIPYLKTKKPQAELALEYRKFVSRERNNGQFARKTEKQQKQFDNFYKQMRQLKRPA